MTLKLRQAFNQRSFALSFWLLALWSTVIEAHYPNELLSANKVTISRVAIKDRGNLLTARFFVLSVYLFPFRCHSSRSRIELRNVEHRELVSIDKAACLFVVRLLLSRETTDDIGREGHGRHLVFQKVAYLVELFNGILTVHLVQDCVTTALNRYMKELINSRMLHDVRHGLKMLENVWRICHTEAEHCVIRHDFDYGLQQVW